MTRLFVLCNNPKIKDVFKNNFVDIIKKRGKKILEIDLSKNKGKKANLGSMVPELELLFDYIIIYSTCTEQIAKICDLIVVLQNELLVGLSSILNKNHVVLLFVDNTVYKNLKDLNSKIIDIGFSPKNTVNITHLDYENDSKVTFNLFFQRAIEDVQGNFVVEKEVKENCPQILEDELLYVYPLITTLKVLFLLI